MKKVGVGIIGVGGIACGQHIPQLQRVQEAEIVAICDINPQQLAKVGDLLALPQERRFKDYHGLIACEAVQAIEICTPNYLHVPMAYDALLTGKAVSIEKPLALTVEQAQPLVDYNAPKDQIIMINFSYRFKPAVRYAKDLIDEGKLGRITGAQIAYLKDSALWKDRGMEWRFEKEKAGTGVLGDLGVHLIDMTQLLIGRIVSVCGRTQTIVTERPYSDGTIGKVETDDICNFMAVLENGIDTSFTISRAAYGHGNTIKFDIFGTRGALSFNLNEADTLYVAGEDYPGTERSLHLVKVPKEYAHGQEQTFINAIRGKRGRWFPTLADGINSQRILDALLLSSVENRWVDIQI
ncbi:MAG: Gfo/Idh/MocA family protein [Christensenellales bacterium]|jgi:predicted dehydrogenase